MSKALNVLLNEMNSTGTPIHLYNNINEHKMETINAALGLSENNGYNHLTLNRVMDTQTIYKINQVEGKNPSGDTIDFFTLTAIIARSESRSGFYKKHKLIKKIVDGLEATGAAEAFYASAVLIGATAIEEYIPQKYKNAYTEGTPKTVVNNSKSIGKAFDPKGKTVQEGVDPNTLNPGKKLDTLDPTRQKNAVKYAGDKPIIVDRNGNVLDGHHRLNDAIKNGRAVDVQIGY